jgi:hypothetical protein
MVQAMFDFNRTRKVPASSHFYDLDEAAIKLVYGAYLEYQILLIHFQRVESAEHKMTLFEVPGSADCGRKHPSWRVRRRLRCPDRKPPEKRKPTTATPYQSVTRITAPNTTQFKSADVFFSKREIKQWKRRVNGRQAINCTGEQLKHYWPR